MKFKITLKDPDGAYNSIREAARTEAALVEGLSPADREALMEGIVDEAETVLRRWLRYGEYLTVEVDTQAQTARVQEV